MRQQLHGKYMQVLKTSTTNGSVKWLITFQLFSEIERFMIAIPGNVIATTSYKNYKEKLPVKSDKSQMCSVQVETIQLIISACSSLAQNKIPKMAQLDNSN